MGTVHVREKVPAVDRPREREGPSSGPSLDEAGGETITPFT